MRTRRESLQGISILVLSELIGLRHAIAADPGRLRAFDNDLAQLAINEDTIESAWKYREYDEREFGPTDEELRAQPKLPKRYSSDKQISERARLSSSSRCLEETFMSANTSLQSGRKVSPV
jgi:hypothetical protein